MAGAPSGEDAATSLLRNGGDRYWNELAEGGYNHVTTQHSILRNTGVI